jgi:hypothetical protein
MSAGVSQIKADFLAAWEAVKAGALSVFEAIKGFVQTYIIEPIQEVIELAKKALAILSGDAGTFDDQGKQSDRADMRSRNMVYAEKRGEFEELGFRFVEGQGAFVEQMEEFARALKDGTKDQYIARQNELLARAQAPPPPPAGADLPGGGPVAAVPAGPVDNSTTNNTDVKNNVTVTVNTQATDAAGTGRAVGSATAGALAKQAQGATK